MAKKQLGHDNGWVRRLAIPNTDLNLRGALTDKGGLESNKVTSQITLAEAATTHYKW